MTTKEQKYPVLWKEFQRLQKRREELYAANAPLREQQEELRRQMDALREQEGVIVDKIRKHVPELTDIDNQLSGLAKAMGGESLNG